MSAPAKLEPIAVQPQKPVSGMKVKHVRVHPGTSLQIGPLTLSSVDAGKHQAEMQLNPIGVFIRMQMPDKSWRAVVVPFPSISYFEVEA